MIKVKQKNTKFFAKVNLGNILKHSSFEGTSYFRAYLNNDLPVLAPMEKRGAYNILATITEPTTASWKIDDTNEHGFIENKQLNNIPDEIFNILRRLGSTNKKMPEMLIFENEDYEIVNTILECIKIDLIKSTETITSLFDKTSVTPITIENLE